VKVHHLHVVHSDAHSIDDPDHVDADCGEEKGMGLSLEERKKENET
jgi:hypothetical protein